MEPRERERESGTSTRTGGTLRLRGAWGSGDDAVSRAVWSQPLKGRKRRSLRLQGLQATEATATRRSRLQYAVEITRVLF